MSEILKNKYLDHLIRHQKKYLLPLTVIILAIPLITNFFRNKPIFAGGESYHYLVISNNALSIFLASLPDIVIPAIPLLLGILSILALCRLSTKIKLSTTFSFFFILFLVLSPAFIFTFTTFSTYSLFVFLTLLGFTLLFENKWLSLLPFALATFFDTYSALVLLFLQLIYFWLKKDQFSYLMMGLTAILLIFNKIYLNMISLAGPFHLQKIVPDLVADLGGLSGIGFFVLLLALVGLTVMKKESYPVFLLTPFILAIYILRTETIFLLTLIIIFFATTGLISLFEKSWNLSLLKKITLVILLLGIIFSTLSYLDRISDFSPTAAEEEVLTWISENTPEDSIVLSSPENSYFIEYFAVRNTLYSLDQDYESSLQEYESIFSHLYIQKLFPDLEKNGISVIYISEDMKTDLSDEIGLLFLLKNERFKLIHSRGNAEAWLFK